MRQVVLMIALISLCSLHSSFGMGWTEIVARKSQPVRHNRAWPQGVEEIVNDATRTEGWRPSFTGQVNDVTHYAFASKNMDDVNRLVQKLAASKAKVRMVRLSFEKEPTVLANATSLPKGNGIACIFSIGDQSWVPLSLTKYTVMPPTLTIYVQNNVIALDALEVPNNVVLTQGRLPLSAGKLGDDTEILQTTSRVDRELLDAASRRTLIQIEAYVSKRAAQEAKH